MTMKLPPAQPRSRLAHEAAHWACEQRRFDDYHAAVFRAIFERGEDIGRIDVLTSLAAEGLNSESLRDALESRRFKRACSTTSEKQRRWWSEAPGIFRQSASGAYRGKTCRQIKEVN
jgi:predicted DsbA family dithiol-disulfide isomerase